MNEESIEVQRLNEILDELRKTNALLNILIQLTKDAIQLKI